MTVGLYVRVSTNELQDVGMQLDELRAYCVLRKFEIYQIYEDKGYSARSMNRPGLKVLLEDMRLKRFEGILVWKFDRFARSLQELLLMIKEIDAFGVQFISLKDQIDMSTPQGRLMMHIVGAFAQFESDIIGERTRSGMGHARRHGTRSGRPIGRARCRDDVRIGVLHQSGLNVRQIALELGVSRSMVYRSIRSSRVIPLNQISQQLDALR